MKIQVTMKDPDTLYDALDDERRDLIAKIRTEKKLSQTGAEAEADALMQPLHDLAEKYFKYSEYVTIELDSEAQTATVVETP